VIREPEPQEGVLNTSQLSQLLRLHREEPQVHTAEKLAQRFRVDLKLLKEVLTHTSLPKVATPFVSLLGC
jgi:hypothetical protein